MIRRSRILDAFLDAAPYCAAVLGLGVAVVVCSGCPARPPVTDCPPNATRCSPGDAPVPEVCSPSHRWYRTAAEPCAEGTQCCLAAPDEGEPIHACVRAAACLPESLTPRPGAPSEPTEPARDPFAGEDGGT